MTKPGIEFPTIANTCTPLSTQPRRTAASMPSRVANTAMSRIDVTTMARVMGKRLPIAV